MPRILELVPMSGGRVGVVLDVPPSDDGSVSLFTATELDARLALARSMEREACAEEIESIGWSAPTATGEWALREAAKVCAFKVRNRKDL